MRYILAVAMLVCVWPLAWAENWVFLRNNDDGQAMFLDTDSIRKSSLDDGETDFTVKHRYPAAQVSGSVSYWESLHYMALDCGKRTVSEDEIDAIDGNGKVVASWSIYDEADYGLQSNVYVPPGSPGDQEIGMVCTPSQ